MQLTIMLPPPNDERQWIVTSACRGPTSYTAMNSIAIFLNLCFSCLSFQYVLVYNFTTMDAIFLRSDSYLTHISTVDIYEAVLYIAMTYFLTVSPVKFCSFQIPTTMSYAKSFNTLLLQAMISSKN